MQDRTGRRLPSPTTVIALVALFVALGGTALALKRDSVRSQHIVDGQVKTADIADGAITNTRIKDGAVTSDDIRDGDLNGDDYGMGSVETEHIGNETITSSDIDEANTHIPVDGLRYVRENDTAPAGGIYGVAAHCPVDESPISGGYAQDGGLEIRADRPGDDPASTDSRPADHWLVTFFNPTGSPVGVTVWAICAPAQDLRGNL